MHAFELRSNRLGFDTIAGVDEAGRGPLAGPVVAAAVILPSGYTNGEIRDSKKLTPRKREALYKIISDDAVSIGLGAVDAFAIDKINILQATLAAMKTAVLNLSPQPDYILIDGINSIDIPIPQETIVRGDSLSVSVAAASIIAKVSRDQIMDRYHVLYPQYNLIKTKVTAQESIARQSENMACARSTEDLSRSNNIVKGREGEDIAAACLRKEGYRIIERNYRCRYGEIDIIAMDADDIVFVEVKSRKSDNFGSPEEAVGITKQRKISRVAINYLTGKKTIRP